MVHGLGWLCYLLWCLFQATIGRIPLDTGRDVTGFLYLPPNPGYLGDSGRLAYRQVRPQDRCDNPWFLSGLVFLAHFTNQHLVGVCCLLWCCGRNRCQCSEYPYNGYAIPLVCQKARFCDRHRSGWGWNWRFLSCTVFRMAYLKLWMANGEPHHGFHDRGIDDTFRLVSRP